MRNIPQFFALIIGLCLFKVSHGQHTETIKFIETSHNFGFIEETAGPVIHEFSFVNNGTEPLSITEVKTSCGCTTPAWTKEVIDPGQEGFIQAQYNPLNRPGKFNKYLTVKTSGGNVIKLRISGEVNPKPKPIEEAFPIEMGALRMTSRTLNMGKVYVNKGLSIRKFEIYNQSEKDVILSTVTRKPAHIEVQFDRDTIKSMETMSYTLSYNAGLKDDLGFMNDSFEFTTNEVGDDSVKLMTVYATIMEYFPPMSAEQIEMAPRLKIADPVIDLGRLKKNEIVTKEVTITNSGRGTLSIRKLNPNCTCLTAELGEQVLEPSISQNVKIIFNTSGRVGNQQKSLTIYSNDPKQSAQRITVKAYIEQ